MGSPHLTPHSARPSRLPPSTSRPLQTLVNSPAITTKSTPRQGIATDSVAGGGPTIVHHSGAPSESSQSFSQPQLSKTFPFLSPGLAARPTSTLPSSAFRLPSERLTRERSRSVSSLETHVRSQGKFESTSSLGPTGSASGVNRASRGRGRHVSLSGVPIADLSVVSKTRRQGGFAARDARSNDVVDSEEPGTSKLSMTQTPAPNPHGSRVVNQRLQTPFWILWYWISGSEQEIPWKGVPRQTVVRSYMTHLSVSSTNLKVLLHRSW